MWRLPPAFKNKQNHSHVQFWATSNWANFKDLGQMPVLLSAMPLSTFNSATDHLPYQASKFPPFTTPAQCVTPLKSSISRIVHLKRFLLHQIYRKLYKSHNVSLPKIKIVIIGGSMLSARILTHIIFIYIYNNIPIDVSQNINYYCMAFWSR